MGIHAMRRCVWHLVWDRTGDRAGGRAPGGEVTEGDHVMVVVVLVIWGRGGGRTDWGVGWYWGVCAMNQLDVCSLHWRYIEIAARTVLDLGFGTILV